MKAKLTTTLVAALLAGSVGVAFAQSGTYGNSNTKMDKPAAAKSGSTASKLTGCNTVAAKEEKSKQGAVPNSSSHNAATTGSNVPSKTQKGC